MFEFKKYELASVKKANTATETISKEEYENRIRELVKCKKDIIYFAEKYFRIISPAKGLHVIKLFEKQKEMLKNFEQNRRVIVLASRQIGKTTSYTIFVLWLCTFFPEQKVMICANKLQTAIEIMDRIRLAYEYLPKWLKGAVTTYNKGEITFANKSTVRAFATSSSASRGFSGNVVILDEMAFIPKNLVDEFFASVMPVISSAKSSKAIIVSTPNGTGNLYYDIWQQANSKDPTKNIDGWTPFRVDWWEVPGRDEEWKRTQIASIGIDRWRQEFCNEFLVGSTIHKLIPDEVIEKYRQELYEMKIAKNVHEKTLQIISEKQDKVYEFIMWKEFVPGHAYLASGDVAEGTGGDKSVLYIWDITNTNNIEMCAKFASSSVSVIEFAYISKRILSLYNNPYLIVESNAIGSSYIEILRVTYEYEHIVREGKDGEFGLKSHYQNKIRACLWLREFITTENIHYKIYDEELIDEMTTFVKKDSKNPSYAAILKTHDDLIVSLMWGAWILSPDCINKYYVVVEEFVTPLDKVIAKTIAPSEDPTEDDFDKIKEDTLYKQYIMFKEEVIEKFNETKQILNKEKKNDQMAFLFPQERKYTKTPSIGNPFFILGASDTMYSDDDFDGPSW